MDFTFLFPRFKLLSGAERLILKLAEALIAKGHRITLVSHQFDDSCRSVLPGGASLVVTGERLDFFRNRYANAAFDYWKTGTLARLIPANTDAVCCFGPALTAAPKIKGIRKLPVLYFCYEPPRFLYTDHAVIRKQLGLLGILSPPFVSHYRNKDKELVRIVDSVLCNSYFGRDQIEVTYGREAHVITHGLDPYRKSDRREAIRQKWGLQPEDIAVITVNYLHPRKRIDLFLQAVGEAHKSHPAVRGIVIGEGPERERLQQIAPNGTYFTGFVPDPELFEYYQASDIYLHTGRLETFGLSVIEAAGNYLPVVSVNEGGPTETVVNGKTGLLCEAGSIALAKAILQLADVATRETMGRSGYEYVRSKYSWEQGADDFLAAVRSIGLS